MYESITFYYKRASFVKGNDCVSQTVEGLGQIRNPPLLIEILFS